MTARLASLGPDRRYRLERRIATGGMGVVWAATDTVLDRDVAVKILKNEYADDPTFRSRFAAEARNAAALDHPNVASVFDFGEVPAEDGSGTSCPFLVMERVPGQPLSALLAEGRPIPAERAAELVAQAADAIGAAHALGIVHRDVKPANLLVAPDGEVKITDFGIARAGDSVPLTQTGQIVGSPHYISPEQAEGGTATEASDLYALGVVLYECLAGHRPFDGDTPVTIALAHLRESAPPLPEDVPLNLRQVVAKALAKDPADRFASAEDFAAALRGAPIEGPPPDDTRPLVAGSMSPVGSRLRLPPWLPVAAAATGAVLLFGAIAMAGGGPSDQGAAASEETAAPTAVQGEQPEQPEQLRVVRSAVVGADADRVVRRLEDRGFDVERQQQENPGGHAEGTVAAVTPHGLVDVGTTVTVFVWGEPVAREGGAEPEPVEQRPAPGAEENSGPPPSQEKKPDRGASERGEKKSKGKAGKPGKGKGKKR